MKRLHAVGLELGIFAFFCVAAIVMTWPLASDPGRLAADVGVNDPLLNARFLRNAIEWLVGNRAGPFDADFFFPHPQAFATTDPALGVAIVALPFRLFTDDYLWLVQVSILATFPLAAHATYLLARRLCGSRSAAIVGGLAFAFCFYRMSQLDHVQMVQMQWLPYGLYFIHKLRDRPTWANALGVTVMVFLNGFGSASVGLYTVPVFPLVGLWCFFSGPPRSRWRFAATLAVAGAVALAALVPFYAPYFEAREIFDMQRKVSEVQHFSAKLEQLWQAPVWSWLYGKRSPMPLGLESATFIGVVVFVFAALAFAARRFALALLRARAGWRRALHTLGALAQALAYALAFVGLAYLSLRSVWLGLVLMLLLFGVAFVRLSRSERADVGAGVAPDPGGVSRLSAAWLYLALGVTYVLFSLGPEVFHHGRSLGRGPWSFLLDVPGYGTVRTPSRFFLVTELCAALLAALGVRAALDLAKSRLARALIAAVVSALLLAELWVAPIPTRSMPPLSAAPAVYHWLAAQPGARPILEVPLFQSDMRYRMYFQLLHKRPTVDAESGFLAPAVHWVNKENFLSGEAALHLERFAAAGLELVIFHRNELRPELVPRWADVLAKGGGVKIATFGASDVYRFPDWPEPRPLSPAAVQTALAVVPARVPGEVELVVTMTVAGEGSVFEARNRKLRVELQGAGGAQQDKNGRLWIAPPLLVPGHVEELRQRIVLPSAGERALGVRVVDEEGAIYSELQTTVFGKSAATARCSVRFAGARTVRVVNEGNEEFETPPTLFVTENAGGKTVLQRTLDRFSPGAAQLVGGLPRGRGELRAVVGTSVAQPWCVGTLPTR